MPQTFKNSTNLTKWTKGFLYLLIFVCVISIVNDILTFQVIGDLAKGRDVSDSLIQKLTKLEAYVAILYLIAYLVSAVFVLKWIYRANDNARQLGASNMRFSSGWSIGWYFIPIANLWKPYQAMKEIWKTSANPSAWTTEKAPALLGWWWFLWIVTTILSNIQLRMSNKENPTLDHLSALSVFDIITSLLTIILTLVLLAIINRIYTMQMQHANQALTSFSQQTVQALTPPKLQLNCQQGKVKIAVNAGTILYQHQVYRNPMLPQDVLGQIENHPKQTGAFILRNKSNDAWSYEADGQSYRIEPTQARPLVESGKIKIGSAELEVVRV